MLNVIIDIFFCFISTQMRANVHISYFVGGFFNVLKSIWLCRSVHSILSLLIHSTAQQSKLCTHFVGDFKVRLR